MLEFTHKRMMVPHIPSSYKTFFSFFFNFIWCIFHKLIKYPQVAFLVFTIWSIAKDEKIYSCINNGKSYVECCIFQLGDINERYCFHNNGQPMMVCIIAIVLCFSQKGRDKLLIYILMLLYSGDTHETPVVAISFPTGKEAPAVVVPFQSA